MPCLPGLRIARVGLADLLKIITLIENLSCMKMACQVNLRRSNNVLDCDNGLNLADKVEYNRLKIRVTLFSEG